MHLRVPIPGLGDAMWDVAVWATGSPYSNALHLPPSPYSFTGPPGGLSRSPFGERGSGIGPLAPVVRCADVLHALYAMLQRRATRGDFLALDERRRERVGREFWMRCQMIGQAAAATMGPSVEQEETNREVSSGVKRIDFMAGKTRYNNVSILICRFWVGLFPNG